jgi:hypothetical protein
MSVRREADLEVIHGKMELLNVRLGLYTPVSIHRYVHYLDQFLRTIFATYFDSAGLNTAHSDRWTPTFVMKKKKKKVSSKSW